MSHNIVSTLKQRSVSTGLIKKWALLPKKTEDKNILLSSDAWLNDRMLDAAQARICKTLGTQEHYQSVLNCQKRVKPYKAVTQEHLQLLHDGNTVD